MFIVAEEAVCCEPVSAADFPAACDQRLSLCCSNREKTACIRTEYGQVMRSFTAVQATPRLSSWDCFRLITDSLPAISAQPTKPFALADAIIAQIGELIIGPAVEQPLREVLG